MITNFDNFLNESNITPPLTFNTTAVKNDDGHYYHFGINRSFASIYGAKPEDVEDIKMKISDDQTIPKSDNKDIDVDYWGWYDFNSKYFSMIYPKRFLLNMCFAYGIEASEKSEQGKSYRLEII
jgi:hypothetical protein